MLTGGLPGRARRGGATESRTQCHRSTPGRRQNTYTAKQFTGVEGSTVTIEDTIEGFNKIADGELDHVAEQAFFMCGGLEDVERKWDEIQKSLK